MPNSNRRAFDRDFAARLSQIGARVRELRLAHDLSQEKLSQASGVDYTYICRIEGGRVNVSMETLHRLASALGVDVIEFLRVELSVRGKERRTPSAAQGPVRRRR